MQDILQQILLFFGKGFCHQFSERSFEAGGLVFSVCSRDTGIYLGFIFTLIVLLILNAKEKEKPAAMPPAWAVVVGIVLIVPMAFDGISSYTGLRETTNTLRYLTGYLCGMGLAVLVSGGIFSLWLRSNHQLSAVNTPTKLSPVLALSALLGAAFYLLFPYLGVVAPFLVLACIWGSVLVVNLLIISTTRFWLRQSSNTKRRILIILICLVAAAVEMALLSFVASALGAIFPWYVHL